MDPDSPPPSDLLDAARRFFPDLTAVTSIPGHSAMARVETPAGPRLVQRWPDGAPTEDIAFSQDAMRIAGAAGLPVPDVMSSPDDASEPVLRLGAHRFTARTWLPGNPPARSEVAWPDEDDRIDVPVALPSALFVSVVAAIAGLHASPPPDLPRQPRAPLAMLPGAVRQAHERHCAGLRRRAPREPAIQRWLATSERLLNRAEPEVLAADRNREPHLALVHLGLWPAHILTADGSLTGLIGWERAAVGPPLLDLAQVVLRLQGWQDESVELALGTYADARPLSPEQRRLFPAVAALDAVASTGRLLEQTYVVPGTARPPGALRTAIDMMIRSLSTIERDLTARESAGKSRRTSWRRSSPSGPRRDREGDNPRVRRS